MVYGDIVNYAMKGGYNFWILTKYDVGDRNVRVQHPSPNCNNFETARQCRKSFGWHKDLESIAELIAEIQFEYNNDSNSA